MKSILLRAGNLLIAEPSIIGDVSFNRCVILISHHSANGSVGFILNKRLNVTLDELVPEITSKFKLFNGGPVEQDNLYFIHRVPHLISNSVEIREGIFWGGSFNTTIQLVNNQIIGENDIKFFLGYSGWDAKQLETELNEAVWAVTDKVDNEEVITIPDASYWRSELKKLGGEYLIWFNAPDNPSHN
jgi:putative transcriptional regulator